MDVNGSATVAMTTSPTLGPNDMMALLHDYNNMQALRYFPVFVYLVVVMVVGTVGNILVLFVYCKRFRKTSSNYFIVAMAVFDLLACVLGLPTEIYDLRYSYSFDNSAVCKILRYTEAVVVYGSAIILVQIAFDRYFKICKPLWMVELYKIKVMCIGAGIAAVIIAIPALVLYGIARTHTPDGLIQGYDCSIEEQYKKKTFSKVYYAMLGLVFVSTVVILSVLYIRIWVEIKRRKQHVIGDHIQSNIPRDEDTPIESSGAENGDSKPKKLRVKYCSEYSDDDNQDITTRVSLRPRLQSLAEAMTKIRVSRTTIVLFAVTVAFVISYLPGIVIMICRSSMKNLESNQTVTAQVLSKLFSKFYFINNAINPVIYSFLNKSFRHRCVMLVKRLFVCRRERVFTRPPILQTDSQKSNKSSKSNNRISNKSTKNEMVF